MTIAPVKVVNGSVRYISHTAPGMARKYSFSLFGLCLWLSVGLLTSAQAPDIGLERLRASYQRPATIPFPEINPYSPAKASLGRRLFFDTILSASQRYACVSCHNPNLAWGNGLPRAIGDNHVPMARRVPTLFNVAWLSRLGWGGRFENIEAVGFVAITGSGNMNLPADLAIQRLRDRPDYVTAFADAFGSEAITQDMVEDALATYERTIISGQAPFDRWLNGDADAIDAASRRGFALFNGEAGCSRCHSGWAFTDGSFHDIGAAHGADIGRGERFPTSTKLRYSFKTPTLRDVALRAPYMHDGSIETLSDVVDLYNRGGIDRPSRSEFIRPLGLTGAQKSDIVAFLHTLTGDAPATIPAPPP